ncbi:efflux RND transporter periplasmic adaptor subunit [Thalassotalea ganghwensis]
MTTPMIKTIISMTLSLSVFFSQAVFAQQGPPANVNVATVKQTTLSPVAWVSGSIVSKNNSALAVEVSGRIVTLAELGDRVKKGDVIATIDDTQIQLQLAEEQSNLATSQARLAFEQRETTRKESLVKQKLISQTDLEQTRSNFEIAQANVEAAKAKVAQIKQSLVYSKLKAPFDGIITKRLSNVGEYVNSGTAILRLVDTSNVEATVFAPLTSYQFVSDSGTMSVRSSLGAKHVPIKAVIPVADTRSHLMEIRLDMSSLNWPIGLNIQAAVANGQQKSVLAIPRDAIVLRRNSTSVFRVNNENKAEQVLVTLGLSEGELIEIIGNIAEGDKLVIRGAERLQPGQSVNIKDNNQALISGKS